MKLILKSLLTTVSIGLIPHTVMASNMNTPPKLILQVTVDQLRADLPRRYMSKMGEGGFKYLYNKV